MNPDAGHVSGNCEPVEAYSLDTTSMHWLLDHRPVPFDQVPPGHAVADDSPEDGQYEATGHSSHAVIPAFDWYLPATHESHAEAPGEALAVPRLQSRHASALVAPLIGWYMPTPHATQPVLVLSPTTSVGSNFEVLPMRGAKPADWYRAFVRPHSRSQILHLALL